LLNLFEIFEVGKLSDFQHFFELSMLFGVLLERINFILKLVDALYSFCDSIIVFVIKILVDRIFQFLGLFFKFIQSLLDLSSKSLDVFGHLVLNITQG